MAVFTLSCSWLLKILVKRYDQITFLFLFDAVCIKLYGSTSNKYLSLSIVTENESRCIILFSNKTMATEHLLH